MPSNIRRKTVVVILLVGFLVGYEKPHDSLRFEPAEVALEVDGLRLDVQRWAHEGQRGTAWRVRLPRKSQAEVVHADALTLLPALTSEVSAPFAAINGGFYDGKRRSFRPMGLVVSDGQVHSQLSERGGSGVVFHDGDKLRIRHRDSYRAGADQALQSIDRVIDGGEVLVRRRDNPSRAPRSAVAITDEAVWLVVLAADQTIVARRADGVELQRQSEDGLSLWAFAHYLRDSLGARYALNLDGGISSQLVVRADGRSFTVDGQQGVLNALVMQP